VDAIDRTVSGGQVKTGSAVISGGVSTSAASVVSTAGGSVITISSVTGGLGVSGVGAQGKLHADAAIIKTRIAYKGKHFFILHSSFAFLKLVEFIYSIMQ
jgi:hypothetical protein